jgi:hypothetical protein
MELHLVDPVAEPVVGAEAGRVLVRLDSLGDHVRPPADRAQLAGLLLGPVGALPAKGLRQHPVRLEHVVGVERRRLVEDLVGRCC